MNQSNDMLTETLAGSTATVKGHRVAGLRQAYLITLPQATTKSRISSSSGSQHKWESAV